MDPKPLWIELLGGFRVRVGDQVMSAEVWRRRKVRSLVKLLALAHGYRLHREQAMELLWPDADPQAALNSLHQTLYLARRILEPPSSAPARYLLLQDEIVALGPPELIWVDVAAFEAAAAQARQRQDPAAYRAALDLYAGELLPEDRYEEWASARRAALYQEHLALLRDLARLAEARADHTVAIQTLHKALAADPADEEIHRELMRLYALSGARQQALRQYLTLREALRRELDLEPAPESQQLYEAILAGRFGAHERTHTQADTPMMAPSDPPAPQHNLPIALTSFIGREREIAEVQRLLATTRLLTLAGPGGCGKTRLAIETAAAVLSSYPDGVWLVELAALVDPALVPQTVAAALGVREAPGQPLTETLTAALRSKHLLLVLDNCEHLITACAHLAEALLRACPYLRILATSREPLHVPGEMLWLVPALSLPDPRRLPPLANLLQYEAIRLLVERAQAVVPSFQIADQHAAALAQIGARLDGMPLAIELAAARVNMLTLEQLAGRLDDCFRLLSGGSRTALSRQQTLKATLDWSYDLLTEREQALLRRLAVFAGGFSLEAAEAIGVDVGREVDDVFDLLSRLVAKSLVVAEQQDALARYRLLETVRQYSAAKLRDTDEETNLRAQHLDWYLAVAKRAEPHLMGPQQKHWLLTLQQERDNLRAALEWCFQELKIENEKLKNDDQKQFSIRQELGLRLARALCWFWYLDGGLSEGGAWFERALARTDETERTWARAMALYGTGFMALHQQQGDLTGARSRLEASSAIFREVGEPHELAMALFVLSVVAVNQGDERAALACMEESLEIFKAVGNQQYYALTLMHMGDVALRRGDWAAARACYEDALSIYRQRGSRWGMAQLLNNLGELARCEGDYIRAARFYEESLASFRELGSSGDIARSIHNLGYVAQAQGNPNQALVCFTESLKLFQERGNKRGIIECIAGMAGVVAAQGQGARAVRLLGAAAAQFQAIGAAMWPADRIDYHRSEAGIRAVLGEEAFAAAWAAGRALTLEQAIGEAFPDEK
jgi:predicted ATPase/DNA-binding SARP family transcriptional activator/Tfp pilus assembly protein PilF